MSSTDHAPIPVPGLRWSAVRDVLREFFVSGADVSAAVAFATESGVRDLAALLASVDDVRLRITVRAEGATEPEALFLLRDELGADVSVVIGKDARRFHPKLWLIRSGDTLTVISGSGNLTSGGLMTNEEQFEVYRLPAESPEAEEQWERYDALTFRDWPLAAVEGSAVWREWLELRRRQAEAAKQTRHLEDRLNRREVKVSRAADEALLLSDLRDLYERTREAGLRRQDGARYVPSRFLQGINRAEHSGGAVRLVARICRRESDGYDIIATAGRADLTVEALVVDASKPYHALFPAQTVDLCRERLAGYDAPPLQGDEPS